MERVTEGEPPSGSPVFMIGQDSRGNWVVRDQEGLHGGLFIGYAEALRYARDEAGNDPEAIIMVNGAFELDTGWTRPLPILHRLSVEEARERRVA